MKAEIKSVNSAVKLANVNVGEVCKVNGSDEFVLCTTEGFLILNSFEFVKRDNALSRFSGTVTILPEGTVLEITL